MRKKQTLLLAMALSIVIVIWSIGAILAGASRQMAESRPLTPSTAPAGDSEGVVDQLVDALWTVEASRQLKPKDGDGGRAIGPFQIHFAYWKDATDFDPDLGGVYEDCRDKAYAERVIRAYWKRYCPEALATGDCEILARVHNGGPRGNFKEATRAYWKKVEKQLNKR